MKKCKRIAFFLLCCAALVSTNLKANRSSDTLFINKDTITKGLQLIYSCAFNRSPVFSDMNATIYLQTGDTLDVTVINNDTLIHDLTVDGMLTSGNTIPPSDSATFMLTFASEGTYRFYSSFDYASSLAHPETSL